MLFFLDFLTTLHEWKESMFRNNNKRERKPIVILCVNEWLENKRKGKDWNDSVPE
jgi:hypothetical protein